MSMSSNSGLQKKCVMSELMVFCITVCTAVTRHCDAVCYQCCMLAGTAGESWLRRGM
jgi:hypothetical protein